MIVNKEQLLEVIKQVHLDGYFLCKQAFAKYFSNSGNMGVFCHYDDEYELLTKIREELTESSDNPDQKYFTLHEPIVIPAEGDVPEATYKYLYIRKPDPTPYGLYTGDVDFYLESEEYAKLKNALLGGAEIKGAKVFNRPGWDMIQLSAPNVGAVGYVSTDVETEKARVKNHK